MRGEEEIESCFNQFYPSLSFPSFYSSSPPPLPSPPLPSLPLLDYFQTEKSDAFSLEEIQITLECLQHDADRDVKFFAGGEIVEVPK